MSTKKKIVLYGNEARAKIILGVNYLADAVKLTLGPSGRNFASGVRGGAIVISNDGVSLAKEIQGRDEFEDIGVRAVREAATKTNDLAGDGTTTAVTLMQAFLKCFGFDLEVIGNSLSKQLKQIADETEQVVLKLNAMAIPITSREHLIKVANVAVENDALAELIGGAQWDVGVSGTVLSEEYNEPKDSIEFIYGVRVDNGLGTSRIANNPEKQALELANVRILVTNKIFNKAKDILEMKDLFDDLIKSGATELVLMGRAFDETAIGLCVKNIQKYLSGEGGFPIYPINAPYTDHDEVMEDLAATVGGKFINVNERNLSSVTVKDVGTATKVFTKRYEGIITGSKRGENEYIDGLVDRRITNIKEKIAGEVSPFEKKNLEARLSQLTAGTALIKVGAETEQERRYKKDKVDDAVNAVKAAMQEGVVPGGGLALKIIADAMPDALIAPALRAPYDQIMANAGGVFDIPDWVQDPLKVVRTACQKASSIARSLATTEIIVNFEEEKPMWVQQSKVNMADNDED